MGESENVKLFIEYNKILAYGENAKPSVSVLRALGLTEIARISSLGLRG